MTRTKQEQDTVNRLLVEAVEGSDLGRMQAYIGIGADIHQSVQTTERLRINGSQYSSSGTAALYHHMYGTYYRENISDYMLSQGVDVDVKNHNGNTPLMIAVKSGDLGRAKYFIAKGANPLATNNKGEMVLEEARKLDSYNCSDRQKIIDALVGAIAAPVAKPQAPQTPAEKELSETKDDITVMKPLSVAPKKPGGGGLNL